MARVGADMWHRVRRVVTLAATAFLVATLSCAAPYGWAYAAPLSEGSPIEQDGTCDSCVDVGFFVAVVKDGTDSYPQSEEELQQILTGVYSPGIYIDKAFDASDFAEFGGDMYDHQLYDLTGEAIKARIVTLPTEEQIAEACARGGIAFDPETQTVVWYVVKSADSVWDSMWHIDGLLVPKEIAPDPGEPDEPDEPDNPGTGEPDEPDPDPGDPDDPDVPDSGDADNPDVPDPDPGQPDDPDSGTDPDDPRPDDPAGPDDGESASPAPDNAGAAESEKPLTSNSAPMHGFPLGAPNNAVDSSGESLAAGATSAAIDSREGASQPGAADSIEPAIGGEAPEASADVSSSIAQDEAPLGAMPSVPGEEPRLKGISDAASTALHVVGALGLAGVAAGVVVANVAAAQAGSALSSLDSQLRGRGRGRRS